jgi:hypothetical protein
MWFACYPSGVRYCTPDCQTHEQRKGALLPQADRRPAGAAQHAHGRRQRLCWQRQAPTGASSQQHASRWRQRAAECRGRRRQVHGRILKHIYDTLACACLPVMRWPGKHALACAAAAAAAAAGRGTPCGRGPPSFASGWPASSRRALRRRWMRWGPGRQRNPAVASLVGGSAHWPDHSC